MVRVGGALSDFLWRGGVLGQVILVLALAGILLAVASGIALVAWKRAAWYVGTAALLVAAAVMGLGALGTFVGRARADRAALAEDLARGVGVRSERVRRDGFTEARVASLGGLLLGMAPLIGGAAAVLAQGGARRERRRAVKAGEGTLEETREGTSTTSSAASPAAARRSVLLGVAPATIAAIFAVIAARAEIPGRDLDKVAWDVLEHEAQIQAGRLEEGCAGLARDVQSLGRAEVELITPDVSALERACAGRLVDPRRSPPSPSPSSTSDER
jgi:hypothetical protein